MIELAIVYDTEKGLYKIYEPSSDTLVASASLSEALSNISKFLSDSGIIKGNMLDYPDISYHIDSYSMKAIVESNINLIKRLSSAPSGFTNAINRFGGASMNQNKAFQNSDGKKKYDNNKGKGSFSRRGSTFSNSGFNESYRKFG